ncbi:hypothetical protein M1M07_14045 [Rhodococcus sp. HM1]|uniref:GIY-YIG nuclease family protein n=1 Tax=Rhodococcus sp. HM1 TaxID=2937759 RepID=UPI00200AB351|nr:hypothetical protein [Rhodococcus sp. HM1]MCK8672224.1 hypothetical protein [Rhodococcus sp. HM1]
MSETVTSILGADEPGQDDLDRILSAAPIDRETALAPQTPVPAVGGIYAWWFDELPGEVDASGCVERDGWTLLYVGISPKAPPRNGRVASSQTLRSRIRTHYCGNAAGSTLRLSLGSLLSPALGIELRRFGSGDRLHFGTGEQELSRWMHDHARVGWSTDSTPWEVESRLFTKLVLPLNLDGNDHCSYYARLKQARGDARAHARSLPVLPNPGVGGRYP